MSAASTSSVIECSECPKVFGKNKHLYAHLRRIHNKEPDIKRPTPTLKCDICGKLFSSNLTLKRHSENFHTSIEQTEEHNYYKKSRALKRSKLCCPSADCPNKFKSYEDLRAHLQRVHDLNTEVESFEFTSLEDFQRWKENVQIETVSFYTQETGSRLLKNDMQKKYFNCHRSYTYVPRGKNIRALKHMGSNKIGKACPSRMEVTSELTGEQISKVHVKFWKTHHGHDAELGCVPLDKSSRAEIAGKLQQGVSFDHILDSIRDSADGNQRLCLIDRKDLHNIVRDFNLDYATKRHQNDAVSVKLWVKEMLTLKEESPILFYKGQGDDDSNSNLENSDFVLIIMTTFQTQQLIKFGQDKICIDGTHGTNAYNIQLYTLMTVDEFGNGCPTAYCFSNRSDEYIFHLFFQQIKLKVGNINANVFMSDDAPAFYNAWESVMGNVQHKLLCTWHVDKNWRLNLNKVQGGTEKKSLIYKTLRVLLQSTCVESFHVSLNSFIKDLYDDNDTKSFGDYFFNHYAQRPQVWAYCYRARLGINTNMYLESYHKILKHVYLEGKKAKRLDKTIHAVIKIARDSLFKRLIKLTKHTPSEKTQRINQSHRSSLSIISEKIKTVIENKEWLVMSSSNSLQEYHVIHVQEMCSELCLCCTSCNICIHCFQCSCTDNLIKMNICKHIHACARESSLCNKNDTALVARQEKIDEEVKNLLDLSQTDNKSITNEDKIVKSAELVIGLATKATVTDESYKCIQKYLNKCIDILNKEEKIDFKISENVNIQKKVDKQVRLYSTMKKRTSTNVLSKPTVNESNVIVEGLLNSNNKVVNIHTNFDHSYTQ